MSVVAELIKVENGGLLSFGNYALDTKKKIDDFEVKGDIYKIKTFNKVTKLEKNENLLFESVPGSTVHNFYMDEKEIKFEVEGFDATQIILELESAEEYNVSVGEASLGTVKTTMGGKLVFSAELSASPVSVYVKKA